MKSLFVGLALVSLLACSSMETGDTTTEYTGPLMRPGWNCLSCHREGNSQGAPVWSAAGTVYPTADAGVDDGIAGVEVILLDASGREVRLVTNEVGNFYTPEPLVAPFTVALEYNGRRKMMPQSPPAGSCNACHALPPVGNAPGRIVAP